MTDTQRPARPSTTKRAPKAAPAKAKARAKAKAPAKRKPAAPPRRAPRAAVDFSYEPDAPRRPPPRPEPRPHGGAVRANGDIHLALADEAWWVMPQVCAKTGEPATRTITYAPSGAPKWAYLAFLLGVVPGVLVVRAAFKNARLKVPFTNQVRRRRSLLMAAFIFGFAIGLPLLVGGLATATLGSAAIGALLLGLAALAAVRSRTRVKVRIVGDDVVISGAHPAFAAAFAMQLTPDDQRSVFENTSGAGKAAVVPPQIKRWNWGAFFFGGIWALGNSVWIGLLGFVPLVNIVMSVVLGIKGNEWAWRKKRWPSVENFLQTQKHWTGAAAALVAATLVLGTIYSFAGSDPATAPGPYGAEVTSLADYASGRGGVRAGDEYGFTATFPEMPAHDEVTQDANGLDLHIHLLTSEPGDTAFSVAVVTYPDAVDVSNPDGLLHAAAQGAAASIPGGKLVRYNPTTVDGDPAAGTLVSASNGVFVRQRLVLRGHRLFTMQVAATTQDPPGFGRFVDSFRVVDTASPAQQSPAA